MFRSGFQLLDAMAAGPRYTDRMVFDIIDNPDYQKFARRSGFRPHEFKRLAGLFSRGASAKALYDMAVDVDMDQGVCAFSYVRAAHAPAYLTFIVRHVGPKTDMYEVWLEGRGRILKSGLFDRAYERLEQEVMALMPFQG